MKRLSSFDASFLANEKGNGHMAIGAVMIGAGKAPSEAEMVTHVRGRLHLLPRFRQRLIYPPFQLGRPLWVDDRDFDITRHLRRETLPAPGTERQFRAVVDRLMTPPLDRSIPLWQICLIDGFEADRFGLIYRLHHALADGLSAVEIASTLFDREADPGPPGEPVPWRPEPTPTRTDLARLAASGLRTSIRQSSSWLGGALREPRRAGAAAADGAAGLREVAVAMARRAPRSRLNAEIGVERRYYWASLSLNDIRQIRNVFGGTLNDVSLAVCTGALRRWQIEEEIETEGLELKALVPVSLRTEDERGKLGNQLTALRGPLPVGIADRVERLRVISDSMRALKESRQALGAQTIWQLNDWFRDFAPPTLLAPTAAINFSTRIFNLLVTNFPGPRAPLYILGRELTGIYPVGFLARRHRLAIAIITYNDSVNIGLLADRQTGPDPERLAVHLETEVEELIAAAART